MNGHQVPMQGVGGWYEHCSLKPAPSYHTNPGVLVPVRAAVDSILGVFCMTW